MSSRSRLFAIAAGLAVVTIAAIMGEWFLSRSSSTALRPGDAATLALGEKVYQAQCASCHGAKLEGQPNWRQRGPTDLLPAPPHDASGHTWHHPDDLLFRITKYGVAKAAKLTDYPSAMPAYDGVLSDEQIIAVLSWIKAQWPASVREQHDQINARQAQAQAQQR